jgi:hypothetical protein
MVRLTYQKHVEMKPNHKTKYYKKAIYATVAYFYVKKIAEIMF